MAVSTFGAAAAAGGATPALSRVATLTSSQTWVHPDGYDEGRLIRVMLYGAGGGGGGGATRGSVYNDDIAGGGAGGSSGNVRVRDLFVTGNLSVVVGAAGTGGYGATTTTTNFSNNNRIGDTGGSGNQGGFSSITESAFGWEVISEGGGGGGRGNSVQGSNSEGPGNGGSYGYVGASSSTAPGYPSSTGGTPGRGRYTIQQGNTFAYAVPGQGYSTVNVETYGGANLAYVAKYNQIDRDADYAGYLSGSGAMGASPSRQTYTYYTSGSNGGVGLFGTGGNSSGQTGANAQAATGYSAGGGGGGGWFFQSNGTYTAKSGSDGSPGLVVIYY